MNLSIFLWSLSLFSFFLPPQTRVEAQARAVHAQAKYDWYNLQAISSLLNIPLRQEQAKYIESLLSPTHNTNTIVERNGRRVVGLLCVQEGVEDHDLLANFLISAQTNAPDFARFLPT